MNELLHQKILIVGLGLMGGSYARGLTDAGMEVGAIDTDAEAIAFALRQGWLAHGRSTADADYIGGFDVVLFALYPHTLLRWVEQYQHCIKAGALLTDVTGVKGAVVARLQALLRPSLEFIGAHPMAGRECSGVQNAKKEIFYGANYIITPTERNTPQGIAKCRALGELLGFGKISVLTPEEHDSMIAYLSQLTHCIAVSLMTCRDTEGLELYSGDSFRDLTRIAKINDEMWSELFCLNKAALLEQMELFSAAFAQLKTAIEADDVDTVRRMMRLSTQRRINFDHINKGELPS